MSGRLSSAESLDRQFGAHFSVVQEVGLVEERCIRWIRKAYFGEPGNRLSCFVKTAMDLRDANDVESALLRTRLERHNLLRKSRVRALLV